MSELGWSSRRIPPKKIARGRLAQAARVEEMVGGSGKPPPDSRRQADKARHRLKAKGIRKGSG
jgi:hypothetical protein